MNKDKRRRRRLFLSILMILFTGVVLTVGTYAWFTANKTVTVESIDVNVAASNGIQVSVDAIDWKTVISNDDINNAYKTYAGATNQIPSGLNNLSPVSTIGDIDPTTGFMKMFSGEINSNDEGKYTLSAKSIKEKNGNEGAYIAFDLFFQVREATDIYLTSKSSVAAGKSVKTGIENATRVAFIDEGSKAAGTAATTIQALANGSTSSRYIWEPNSDVHTASALANASSNYGKTTLTATASAVDPIVGVKAEIPEDENILLDSTDELYFASVTPGIITPKAGISDDKYEKVLKLQAGVTKVRIYMWVEGQDVDCENNASGGSITFDLQFSSSKNAADTE